MAGKQVETTPWNVGDLRRLVRDPDGLVLDSKLRRDVLTCGELAQACYDSVEKEASSFRRCWNIYSSKPEKIQDAEERQRIIRDSVPIRSGAAAFNVQEEFFGTAGFHSLAGTEPNQLLKTLTLRAWSDLATEPNRKIWVGFSAECGDDERGYDIVLCWRGTMHAEEWTINVLGDVLTYWEEEPTSRERWLHGKMWWASRVHFGFRQLYCGNYEPPPHEAVQEQARRVHFGRRSSKPLDDVDQDAVKADNLAAPGGVAPAQSAAVAADAEPGLRHAGEGKPVESSFESPQLVRTAMHEVPCEIWQLQGRSMPITLAEVSQQVRRMVQRLISDMKSGRKRVRSITVTGHSLGGALAVLCADDVGRQLQAQRRLNHAVRSSSELLELCRHMPMPAEARDAIDDMERSLANARETSEDIGLSRASAASAVGAARDAVRLVQEALGYAGYLHKQQRRTQQLLDLLTEADDLFDSHPPASVAPAASKLHKAAETVLHKQKSLSAPTFWAAVGRGICSIGSLVLSQSSRQAAHAGDARAAPAAINSGDAETQSESISGSDASLKSPPETDSHAAPIAEPALPQVAALQSRSMWRFVAAQQKQRHAPDNITDTGWKIMIEAVAAHCSAAAALAMVSAQYGMPAPDRGRRGQRDRTILPSPRSSPTEPGLGKAPDDKVQSSANAVGQSVRSDGAAATNGLSAKSEKATVSPSVMGYGADSTWMPVLRAVTFAAPHVGNAAFVRRMEGRGVQVLRVVNRWDYVPHVPGVMHVLTAVATLWLRKTPRYRLNPVLRFLLRAVPWWAYDDTKACLILDSDRNTLLKAEKRRSPKDAHLLEGYLFLVAAQYRRWTVPQAVSESQFDFFIFTVAVCVCIAYAGYVVGIARALEGHLHLGMPGLLLPTGLAIVYSTAGVLLGGGLVMGAVLGSHWCDVIVQGLLGPRFRRWVRQPKQRVLWKRINWATSVLGCVLGPVFGAAASFLFGLFFVGLLLAYLAQSVGLFLIRSTYSPLVATVRLLSKASRSGLWSAAVSAVAGMSESAVETVDMIQENKDGFDRKNYQQTMGEVLKVTGRAPALLNKTSDVLNPVLGVPPNWWVPPHKSMQNRNGQWRERRNEELGSIRRRDKSMFAEGDPVSLHHQLDRDAEELLDPIALATIEGEPDDHVPSPVDKNVVYVRLVDRNVLANSETRTALDDALKFAFPMAQHLRNVDQVEGCLWWPQDGLRRTTFRPPEQDDSETQTPEHTFSSAKCLLNKTTSRRRRHQMPNRSSAIQDDLENPSTEGGDIPCQHLLCAIWAAIKDPVFREHHAPSRDSFKKPVVKHADDADRHPVPGLWRREPMNAFATLSSR